MIIKRSLKQANTLIKVACGVYIIVYVFIFILFTEHSAPKTEFAYNESAEIPSWLRKGQNSCIPHSNIGYLKAHKTASTSIQNILFRYGLKHNLQFALPRTGHFNETIPFSADMIYPQDMIGNFEINIFAIHSRWNIEQVKTLLPSNSVFIASVRDPLAVFESMFGYYRLHEVFNKTLDEFVRSNITNLYRPDLPDSLPYLGYNQLLYDFGLSREDSLNETVVNKFIQEADNTFDLVIVAELFEESLILMNHLLCWSYEDIVTLQINARKKEVKNEMETETKQILRDRLRHDSLLYNHFKNKLKRIIKLFGSEEMAAEIKKLRESEKNMRKKCKITEKPKELLKVKHDIRVAHLLMGYEGITSNSDCKYFTYDEGSFQKHVRKKQMMKVRKKLGTKFEDVLAAIKGVFIV